jgi:Ca-activated chloride channel homolog
VAARHVGNLARILLGEIDVRLPFLLRLFAAISIPLVAQDTKNWRNQQRDSQATIRVTADLVLVPVTVTESSGKPVLGLEKRDFVLTDDKVAQEILSFSREIAPVSVGIVFDLSGSMSNKIGKARTAVREFLRYLETGDEVLLVTFNDNAQQRTEFASEDAAVLNELLFARPAGSTALLDAVALAVRAMRKAQNGRRVLLVISDGEDNHSRLSERELKRILEETEIQIHALGIHDRSPGMGAAAGPKVLEDLAQMTGGEHHMVNDAGQLPGLAAQMGLSLHDRYLLGYRPSPPGQPGKWRRIRVRLPDAPRSYQVYARTGYRLP